MPKKVQTIIKVIECPNPRCPSRTLNPLGFQVVFKKFQNNYMVLCPHCGNPIHYSEKWDFEFIDERDYRAKRDPLYKQTPNGKAAFKRGQKTYDQTTKGKKTKKKYGQSDKGKKAAKRYHQSEKGKISRKKARIRYDLKKRFDVIFI